ncbi:MAG: radical SAM protein [Candidatus Woesearchaeota archaeon]
MMPEKTRMIGVLDELYSRLRSCNLCPRSCNVDRIAGKLGFCKAGKQASISFTQHFGEEPVLVGKGGSGTIFFSGCNLSCVYCQNYEISQLKQGKSVGEDELASIMLELQDHGCHNINLVSPTPHVPAIVKSLGIAARAGLKIPIVYNTGTYDSVDVLMLLEGLVDIYMPDAKYADSAAAEKYSAVPGYPEVMKACLREMHRQVGDLAVDKHGIAKKGLLVRHLVLPRDLAGSKQIFEFLANEISENTFVNVMAQYRPCYKAHSHAELSRPLTGEEHREAVFLAKEAGLKSVHY